MRVLVTGASGFIGRSLCPALCATGHEIRSTGRDMGSLDADLAGCDAVVHLANIAHTRTSKDILWRVNVQGSRRVAERAAACGVRRLIYVSSIKASGEETAAGAVYDGTEVPAPKDEYGRTKLAAEQALSEVARRTGLQIVVLRPPLVYGPDVKANFLGLLRAIDGGWPLPFASIQNRRSLLYVGNLVDAIVKCMELPQAAGRIFVANDGESISTPGLCRALGQVLSRPARLFRFPPALLELYPPFRSLARNLEVDDSAIRRTLGWRPPFTLQEGLRATAQWFVYRSTAR